MIRIQTDDGPVNIDAEAKDVTVAGGHLKITRDGVVVAQFRKWDQWYQTEKEDQS